MRALSPHAAKAMLADGRELALIDLREELVFSERHLLWARSVPLSRLELRFARLVPRKNTRIVLCDDADGLVERAAKILADAGYTDLAYLQGGVAAWAAAGFEPFAGINVPSKAFGEFVEHTCETPSIAADELHCRLRAGADMVVLDARPFDEYSRVSIPTATNVPGAELVLRIRDLAPSPDTTVVVNCAGRTRSIIGAQSLINAGVPNKVVALRNGTMGWQLAGLTCERGKDRRAPAVSDDGLAWAQAAADRVARRFEIPRIDRATIERWRADADRTLYVFDVRDLAEYAAGHIAEAQSAPGGQLLQATDQYVGTLGARIVLVDDAAVRAVMTGSWLRQMGFADVSVLVERGTETKAPESPILGAPPPSEAWIDCGTLSALLADDAATMIDLSLSREYFKAHIPRAFYAVRSRLSEALRKIPLRGELVLTSEDGVLAGLAVAEASAIASRPARALRGGNAAWRAVGYPVSAEPLLASTPVDLWLKPYERLGDTAGAMAEYLSWETDLLTRIARDGTCNFMRV
jgi:rhodanese-related sulfurtransferase